jgi:2-polyprenyl-3-methyl-5-hydroxy-6-metoxy-1,4-benzoquinol methylase
MVTANKNKKILDVCCGEGLLLDSIEGGGYEAYLGFDFSYVALRKASQRANVKATFVHGFGESFVPDGQFDSIIFNECLYYFAEPLRVLCRYEPYLAPEGVMIVSLFTKTERVQLLASEISSNFRVARSASVSNGIGTWKCSMLTAAS